MSGITSHRGAPRTVRGFVYCPACDAVSREHPLVAGFAPDLEEAPAPAGGPGPDFAGWHAGHGLRRLETAEGRYVSEEAYGSEADLAFHDAVGGDGSRCVVELQRDAPGRPIRYRVRDGRLVRTRRAIVVDPLAIAHVLAAPAGRPPDPALLRVAGRLAEAAVEAAAAVGFDALEARAVAGRTPLVSHAPLPDEALQPLLDTGRQLLAGGASGAALDVTPHRLAALVERHAAAGGAFAPILEVGYALVGRTGAVLRHLRRTRTRTPGPATRG